MLALFAASGAWAQINIPLDSADPFSVNVSGFAQVRYTYTDPAAGPANQTFDLALGRVALSGKAFDPRLNYFFQVEGSTFGNSNRLTLLDAWLSFAATENFHLKGGRILLPYSRQFYTHPGQLLFCDLSIADYAFNLPRSIGGEASGHVGRMSFNFAAMNSVRALDGTGQRNGSGGLGTVGRLEFDILSPYGYLESSPKLPDRPQLSAGLAAAFNPVDEASTFQNTRPGDRTVNGTADVGFRWNRLTAQAAGYVRQNRLADGSRSILDAGLYAQAGVYLQPGRWEAAYRHGWVNFENRTAGGLAQVFREDTLGINRYFRGHNLKMQADYMLASRRQGASRLDDHGVRVQFQFLF